MDLKQKQMAETCGANESKCMTDTCVSKESKWQRHVFQMKANGKDMSFK